MNIFQPTTKQIHFILILRYISLNSLLVSGITPENFILIDAKLLSRTFSQNRIIRSFSPNKLNTFLKVFNYLIISTLQMEACFEALCEENRPQCLHSNLEGVQATFEAFLLATFRSKHTNCTTKDCKQPQRSSGSEQAFSPNVTRPWYCSPHHPMGQNPTDGNFWNCPEVIQPIHQTAYTLSEPPIGKKRFISLHTTPGTVFHKAQSQVPVLIFTHYCWVP